MNTIIERLIVLKKIKKRILSIFENEFKIQDYIAEKSEVFKKILQSELGDDPIERYVRTNSPKSKTRNALLSLQSYIINDENGPKYYDEAEYDIEEWEKYLLSSSFYGLTGE